MKRYRNPYTRPVTEGRLAAGITPFGEGIPHLEGKSKYDRMELGEALRAIAADRAAGLIP